MSEMERINLIKPYLAWVGEVATDLGLSRNTLSSLIKNENVC